LRHFGFTTEHVVEAALAVLERVRPSIKARV
jgi:hypothetical protein